LTFAQHECYINAAREDGYYSLTRVFCILLASTKGTILTQQPVTITVPEVYSVYWFPVPC